MKRFLMIALMLLAVVLLVSCDPAVDGPSDTTTASAEPDVRDIVFVGGGLKYSIVRPEDASDDVKAAATKLYTELKNHDADLAIATDWHKKDDPIPTYEILLGNVDREELGEVLHEVPFGGFVVKVIGEKLAIVATNDDYIDEAVDYVISLVSDGKLTLKADYVYSKDFKEGSYRLENAMIGGRKLSEYSICAASNETAKYFQQQVGEMTGALLPIVKQSAEGPKFIIGKSAVGAFAPIEYYEYRIESKGEDVYFFAYGEHELKHSYKVFFDMLEAADSQTLTLSETIASYKLPAREEYINDPSKLYMLWDYLWEAPEWMLDYNDKKNSLFGGYGSDRLYASAHRAELTFYPENSIEAVISSYYMGAAIVELDFCATKDGVLVLMHDDTLSRTTNCDEFIGKIGYPNSAKVSSWTYEQLMDLNLKEGGGGSTAKVTPFKIATLEEALTVCKERMFIVPDKYANWQYIKSSNIMQNSKQYYLVDVMKKTGNYESILISYGISSGENYLNATDAVAIQKLLKAETGVTPFILLRCTPARVNSNYNYFASNAEPNSFALQLNGDYRDSTDYRSAYRAHGDKVTFLAWTIGTGSGWNDYRENWKTMYEKGLRVIMTNDLFELCKYCAEVGEDLKAD